MPRKGKTTLPADQLNLVLTKTELLTLQLHQFQLRAFEAELQLEIARKSEFLKQIDPLGKLAQHSSLIRGRTEDIVHTKKEGGTIKKQIEERLGISLSDWAYDDLTGNLVKVKE